ncbi:hypothetical protein INR49_002665 [Caranx melampygus]|nr:hypothetical protein INR49_002665 [Caranx melampygus]
MRTDEQAGNSMPTAKGKGGSASHRYRPASEYDDTTLAQKREYWRTKKREQRARLTERRGKLTKDNGPTAVNSCAPGSFGTHRFPMHETYKAANVSLASQSGNTVGGGSCSSPENQKEKWIRTTKVLKIPSQLPASCSISAKAAEGNRVLVKCRAAGGAVNRAVTSPTSSGTQLNTSSSVPPFRVTRITNGSSAKTAPQPCVSMQGTSVPTMQQKAQVVLHIQPKLLPTNVTTGGIPAPSPCSPVTVKTEGDTVNATPQSGTKSALVTTQRAKGVGDAQPSAESEEERAAKRREHWRIKKREQRAKLAARIAKARERTQGVQMMVQRESAQKPGLLDGTVLQHLPSQSFVKGAGQRQCPARGKTSFTSAKRENNKLQIGTATVNLQVNQIKVQNPHENRKTQTTTASNAVKKTGDSQRKLPSYLSNVSRGIARCKTPRQRLIEAQKNLLSQRSIRCKSPLLVSMFGTRNIPRIDPNDTPEQIIAKRREYWRIKKREQRAKLSMEVKTRLKEKDSLMRRVKRYQRILEEMRRARVMAQTAGSTLTHASETIGGFIKEDGTVTVNIPQGPTGPNTSAHQSEDELHAGANNTLIIRPQRQPSTKRRGATPVRINQPSPFLRSAQVKVFIPLSGQSVNKSATVLSIRPRTQLESTTAPNSHSSPRQNVGQLTLTHPQTPPNALSEGSAAGSNLGGCVMKMAVSSSASSLSALSLDPELTEEERMAKKREYWRIKKREQRAARAARLKQGLLQARANAAMQRRRAQRQVTVTPAPQRRSHTNHTGSPPPLPSDSVPVTPNANEIKQESQSVPAADLNSQPEQAICPDIKPPTSPPPPPVPQPESDPALSADSQATTLLAVASMKKLLEESLSTVRECNNEQMDIKTETAEEPPEQEMKPIVPQLFFEKEEVSPIAADLTLQIKSWQPDTDDFVNEGSPNPDVKDSSLRNETPLSPPTSNEEAQHPTCEQSSQTLSNIIVSPSMEASDSPSSPRRAQRLRNKRLGRQNCCSPEPPKLHHLPMDPPHLQQRHVEQQAHSESKNRDLPSAESCLSVATEQSGWTSLQRKREYWKLMKRQQRARLKARQKERHGECSSHLSPANIQAPGLVIINSVKDVKPLTKPALQPKPSVAPLAAADTSVPAILVVSPATHNAEQSPDTLQVNLPVTSVSCSPGSEQNDVSVGPSQIMPTCLGAPENQHQAMSGSQEWMSRSTDVDSSACLPTLKPPDNPLSSINLQPIEPPGQTLNSTLSPLKIPIPVTYNIQSPAKLTPLSTLVPPKPILGESEEDFLKRKREYWRIKKKEQRARKAIRERGVTPRRATNSWRPILPARGLPTHDLPSRDLPTQVQATQDSGQWVSSSDESEHLMSTSVDTDQASFPYSSYTVPIEGGGSTLSLCIKMNIAKKKKKQKQN